MGEERMAQFLIGFACEVGCGKGGGAARYMHALERVAPLLAGYGLAPAPYVWGGVAATGAVDWFARQLRRLAEAVWRQRGAEIFCPAVSALYALGGEPLWKVKSLAAYAHDWLRWSRTGQEPLPLLPSPPPGSPEPESIRAAVASVDAGGVAACAQPLIAGWRDGELPAYIELEFARAFAVFDRPGRGDDAGRMDHDGILMRVLTKSQYQTQQIEGTPGREPANQFSEVLALAAELSRDLRRLVEMVCERGGKCPLPDLALALEWGREWKNSWDSAMRRVNKELQRLKPPYHLMRDDNCAVLVAGVKKTHMRRK
jgi:hypothetical protein